MPYPAQNLLWTSLCLEAKVHHGAKMLRVSERKYINVLINTGL